MVTPVAPVKAVNRAQAIRVTVTSSAGIQPSRLRDRRTSRWEVSLSASR